MAAGLNAETSRAFSQRATATSPPSFLYQRHNAAAASLLMRGAWLHMQNQRRSCVGNVIGTGSLVNASTISRLTMS